MGCRCQADISCEVKRKLNGISAESAFYRNRHIRDARESSTDVAYRVERPKNG
jgi:hypothetical protein